MASHTYVFALDGTFCRRGGGTLPDEMYSDEYISGVGTRGKWRTRRALKALWGGVGKQVKRAVEAWERAGSPRNVGIVGFSRGAQAATMFANEIYQRAPSPRVRVVLLDRVATQGLPTLRWLENRAARSLPKEVTLVHFMAAAEGRAGFQVERLPPALAIAPRVYELWVPGASHREVGTGEVDRLGLSGVHFRAFVEKFLHGEASVEKNLVFQTVGPTTPVWRASVSQQRRKKLRDNDRVLTGFKGL